MEHVRTIGGKRYSGTIVRDQRDKFHWTRGGLNLNERDTVPRSTGLEGNGSCCGEQENCNGFQDEGSAEADFELRQPRAASASQ
jgi:hypothetical protein